MGYANILRPAANTAPSDGNAQSRHPYAASALGASPTGFDPVRWLADFNLVGGGWALVPHLCLFFQIDGRSASEQQAAQQLIADLSDDDRAAVINHLCAGGQTNGQD